MKRILFVLGVLGVMGLASSFSDKNLTESIDPPVDGGCGSGSRVCVSSPGLNHI